jgi:hypothetical protein
MGPAALTLLWQVQLAGTTGSNTGGSAQGRHCQGSAVEMVWRGGAGRARFRRMSLLFRLHGQPGC